MMTLGMTRVTDQMSTRFGSASSSSRGDDRLLERARRVEEAAHRPSPSPFGHRSRFPGGRRRALWRSHLRGCSRSFERAKPLQLSLNDIGAGLKAEELIGSASRR
jgi:hypothetical protein